ncbi:MAG: glycosyltransferase family 2 protein [Fibromonadaceae bacterium]|jgi:glycosyltransferase involved in cell wall biosynthesis|nr:glycosyltransferase family 2 protein [Fibromonadaceae bacterium]
MSWHTNYLEYFEKPYSCVPQTIVEEVRNNLTRFQTVDSPMATIAVIARNEETRLFSCLWALSESCCNYPIEFIGIDNDSTDRTAEIFDAVGIRWFTEMQKSCGYARRCGLEHAKGKYYFCIDSDTLYPPHYIQMYITALEKPGIVGVSSFWSFIPDEKHSKWGLKTFEFFRDIHVWLLSFKRPELAVRGLTFAYRAEYGRKVGYRVEIIRGEDGSMAFGLLKYGKLKLILSRKARVITATNTLGADGSLFKSFTIRVKNALKGFSSYFTKRTKYVDKESNLIDAFKKSKN